MKKSPAVAGKFYTENKDELIKQLNSFKKYHVKDYDCTTRAIIVPHAGYFYSGQLASEGFQYLDKKAKNVFIIAPPHYIPVKNVALSIFNKWSTPLGEVEVNQEINQELVRKFGCEFEDDAFEQEHSIEVQLPFLQENIPGAKIVPILAHNQEKVREIIEHYWKYPENAFVISSDLSHFYDSKEARKIDKVTAEMIETNNMDGFEPGQACGAMGISALGDFAKSKGFSLIRVGLINSGDITGDTSRVVGYGSWMLYEGTKNEFIKKYFSEYVVYVCKKSILAKLDGKNPVFDKIPEVFKGQGACFVTLEKDYDGQMDLRGCIGSIIAHRPLMEDLVNNAQGSAFSDPRFQPLKREEFDKILINVSLLSVPEKMNFATEGDLLELMQENVDGIIIKDGAHQAVYLPSVWEQLPNKVLFLESLKIKAGLPPHHFSSTFEAFRFTSEYIKGE